MGLNDLNKIGFLCNLVKGVYADNYKNRKLGRVGQQYGGGKGEEDKDSKQSKKPDYSNITSVEELKDIFKDKELVVYTNGKEIARGDIDFRDLNRRKTDLMVSGTGYGLCINKDYGNHSQLTNPDTLPYQEDKITGLLSKEGYNFSYKDENGETVNKKVMAVSKKKLDTPATRKKNQNKQ